MIATIGLWSPKTAHTPPRPVVFYIQSHCDIDVRYAEKMLTLYGLQNIQTCELEDLSAIQDYANKTYGLSDCELKKFQMDDERTGTYQYDADQGVITKPNN